MENNKDLNKVCWCGTWRNSEYSKEYANTPVYHESRIPENSDLVYVIYGRVWENPENA